MQRIAVTVFGRSEGFSQGCFASVAFRRLVIELPHAVCLHQQLRITRGSFRQGKCRDTYELINNGLPTYLEKA
jgi:hypothetical protein